MAKYTKLFIVEVLPITDTADMLTSGKVAFICLQHANAEYQRSPHVSDGHSWWECHMHVVTAVIMSHEWAGVTEECNRLSSK